MASLEKLKSLIPIHEIEQSAQTQIYANLELDFLKVLAIMPDVHMGYTLPIGGVALLDNVISPEYVGYDIGCFIGSTKIPLLDGKDYLLKELYDKKIKNFPVYSIDENGDHKIGIADEVKLTRKNAKLVKVILDNDKEFICTPDHELLNINAISYTKVYDLNNKNSIFPFHRYLDRDGYEYLGVHGTSKIRPTSWIVAESGLLGDIPNFKNSIQIHHKDKNKLNNFPYNLQFIDKIEHCKLHGLDRNYFATDDFKEKKRKTILERGYFFDPKFKPIKKNIAIKNIKEYMSNNPEYFKEIVTQNGIRGGKFFSKNNSNKQLIIQQKLGRINKLLNKCIKNFKKITKENYEITRKQFYNYPLYNKSLKIIKELGYNNFDEYIKDDRFSSNHKIKEIIELDYTEDVYCLTVNTYHNFAISAGIFVHNCGMCCVVTDTPANTFNRRKREKIFNEIYKVVPVGLGIGRKYPLPYDEFKSASGNKDLNKKVNSKLYIQLSSLGSGNHFIELGENEDGFIVATIHSGSRNIGHSIAQYYMNKSKIEDKDLPNGFFRLDSDMGKAYKEDLDFALNYALYNRMFMMTDVLKVLGYKGLQIEDFLHGVINENHNHAIVRDDGVLHRKGATPAEKGTLGVIPGTMKSGVYITKGLGNEEFLCSASHGAGRKMSRTKAKKMIKLSDHKHWMEGIIAKVDKSTIDESHGAYKNLKKVIKAQEGIVIDVVDYVKPFINVKG